MRTKLSNCPEFMIINKFSSQNFLQLGHRGITNLFIYFVPSISNVTTKENKQRFFEVVGHPFRVFIIFKSNPLFIA